MVGIEISFNAEKLINKFLVLRKDSGKINRKIIRAILQPARNEVRKAFRGGVLKSRTGRTARNMDVYAFTDGHGWLKIGSWYGRLFEKEKRILPKNKEFLHFKIGKQWIKAKEVVVSAKNPIMPIWKKHTSDENMVKVADGVLQKELERYFKV